MTILFCRMHCVFAMVFLFMTVSYCQPEDLPDEFEQILPRGRIAAITNPVYVSADNADISGDSWILGLIIDGEARAYSLNLLNRHEVVNDEINDTKFAAVW